jgi:ATP-binding cassette, subfamily B, bacterial
MGDAMSPASQSAPRSTLEQLRPVAHLAMAYRGRWALAFLFLGLAAAATLSVPLAFRGLIDSGLEGLTEPFAALMALSVFLAAATAGRFYFMSWLGERVVADLRKKVYDAVLSRPPTYFETLQTGEVLSRLTADTTLVQTLVGTSVSMALRSSVLLVGGVSMMLVTSPMLAGLMVLLLLGVVLPVLALGRRVRKMSKVSQDKVADTSALAGEILNAMTTVQSLGREPYEGRRYGLAVESAFETALRRIRGRSSLTFVAIVLAFLVIVFVLWLGAREVVAGTMSAGELAQFVLYAVLTAGSIAALAEGWGDLQRAVGATERLVSLMERDDGLEALSAAASQSLLCLGDAVGVAFESVSFSYPSRPRDAAVSGLNFEIPAGETWALVGPSGAGKTTIFSLLLGFHQPSQGCIRFNGRPAQDWGDSAIRQAIGWVPQDPVIFSDDAMGNIRYGRLDASDEEVVAAARAAHADEFIRALPSGYQTFLGERGLRLSGGQRQRIAIARAVLRNPPLLLLDEATSALDTVSERAVQQALERLLPGRTALVIAHRLSTVRRADRILVLDQGQLVASGRHAELMETSELYRTLAQQQFWAVE